MKYFVVPSSPFHFSAFLLIMIHSHIHISYPADHAATNQSHALFSCLPDHEVSTELILLNHGGVQDKDLVKIVNDDLNSDDDDDDDEEMDTMNYSPYFLPSRLPNNLINSKSSSGF